MDKYKKEKDIKVDDALVLKIRRMIDAGYSSIGIQTIEEVRLNKILTKVSEATNFNLYFWDIVSGWRDQKFKSLGDDAGAGDYIAGANYIYNALNKSGRNNTKIKTDSILVMYDMGEALEKDLMFRRLIKNLLPLIMLDGSRFIFIFIDRYPMKLEELAIVDFPLPDRYATKRILYDIMVPDDDEEDDTSIEEEEEISIKEIDKFLSKNLNLNERIKDQLIDAALGMTEIDIGNAYALAKATYGKFNCNEAVKLVVQQKAGAVKKSGVLEFYNSKFGKEDIGGYENFLNWLIKRREAFTTKAKEYGISAPKGVLVGGPPGTGKSLIVKAISNIWQMPILKFDVGAIFGSLVGQSEENLRKALAIAEVMSPTILWIDEIEKGFGGMTGSSSDSGTSQRVFATLLNWMNDHEAPVFVAATFNDQSGLPAELMRKGRFDRIWCMDLPNECEREKIFNIHILKRSRIPKNFNISKMVERSEDFTGAEIEAVIEEAMNDAFAENREFTSEDILKAIKKDRKSTIAFSQSDKIKKMRDWAIKYATPASEVIEIPIKGLKKRKIKINK